MISSSIMKFFLVAYFVLFIICLFEKNWGRAIYWFGAATITSGVLIGT